jgi:nicotinamidase-related amidase
MPFTELDEKTALLVIDLQTAAVSAQLAHPVKDVIANVTSLIEAFRKHRLPIVLVNVAGTPAGRNERGTAGLALPEEMTRLIGELGHHPDDVLITKNAWSAFSGTGLTDKLHAAGVTQVVITGIATSVGVESTARDAHGDGFHVSLPVDAMTDPAANSHDHSVTHIFPQLAETGTTAELLQLLEATRSA